MKYRKATFLEDESPTSDVKLKTSVINFRKRFTEYTSIIGVSIRIKSLLGFSEIEAIIVLRGVLRSLASM